MHSEKFLAHIARHVRLSQGEIELLLSKVVFRTYLKGQFVVQAGDVCKHQNYVLSGCLKSFSVDRDGQEHIATFAIQDWWTGDLGSFITQQPADYNVQCIEKSELVQIPHESMELLFAEIPTLERFFRILIQNSYVATQRRLIDRMSLHAKELYLQFCETYPEMHQRIPQYMIASFLGITPQFLSKIKRQIARGEQPPKS